MIDMQDKREKHSVLVKDYVRFFSHSALYPGFFILDIKKKRFQQVLILDIDFSFQIRHRLTRY